MGNHFDRDKSFDEIFQDLRNLRLKNMGRVIVANLNINSIRNKFDQLKAIINENVDILIITETKIDDSFPDAQFKIDGYAKPYRLDRNSSGGGLLIYVREDIPSKQLSKHTFPSDIEGIFVEINLRKSKWLLFGTYHPPSQSNSYFFESLTKAMDIYLGGYDRFLLAGDFNCEESEQHLKSFLDQYHAINIVKEKTCFKSVNNPSCIDLFITNQSRSFQNTTAISSGLSDFHKMVLTVFKTKFEKQSPKIINYRSYKNFDEVQFKNDIQRHSHLCTTYAKFEKVFLEILEIHAPLKRKLLRANEAPYMTRTLRKAMMRRSQLESKYYKTKASIDLTNYKRQKNYVSRLYKKERAKFFKNLDLKSFLDNKNFWKNVKPFFSEKGSVGQKISIVDGNNIISDSALLAEHFKTFFKQAVDNLDLPSNNDILNLNIRGDLHCPIDIITAKFASHPSILKIRENMTRHPSTFSFHQVGLTSIKKTISQLNNKKATTFGNVPTKELKRTQDICGPIIQSLFNETITNFTFSNKLKYADVSPIFKKGDATSVKNFRNVSVLPVVSKVYEREIQSQLLDYFEPLLSPHMCGYRKGYSTQYALVALIERWRESLDKGGYAGAMLMDLSKAFDTIDHKLLIAKLCAYGLDKGSLLLIMDYLSERLQRVKVDSTFSLWSKLSKGVPQGSVLGPLLFNIYVNDLFWVNEMTEVCNFADDTTFYTCDNDIKSVIRKLEHDTLLAIEWFGANFMKLNEEKCHFLFAGHKHEVVFARAGSSTIWESTREKLLGVYIDKDLSFKYHVSNLCKKASQKLSALIRLGRFYNFSQRRLLMKSFIESQFGYSRLAWMFHDRGVNNKIDKIQERALRYVYGDDVRSFEDLLEMDGSVKVHHRNIQAMALEMFKVKNGSATEIMNNIFKINRNPNRPATRSFDSNPFCLPRANTVHYGHDSLGYFGYKIWNLIPEEIRQKETVAGFKNAIKSWFPSICPCRLCQNYIGGVGYVTTHD